jgi:hypothetical protein
MWSAGSSGISISPASDLSSMHDFAFPVANQNLDIACLTQDGKATRNAPV